MYCLRIVNAYTQSGLIANPTERRQLMTISVYDKRTGIRHKYIRTYLYILKELQITQISQIKFSIFHSQFSIYKSFVF